MSESNDGYGQANRDMACGLLLRNGAFASPRHPQAESSKLKQREQSHAVNRLRMERIFR